MLAQWYTEKEENICNYLGVNKQTGLSAKEAKKRLTEFGYNEVQEQAKISPLMIFLAQFKDFMVIILIIAAIVSSFMHEFLDAITIIVIVIMNGILGFMQEYRAEKSLKSLKDLSAPTAKVLRDGEISVILSKELVLGDIVYIEEGDRVPADVRMIETVGLNIDEAMLTGESIAVRKVDFQLNGENLPLGDQKNMCFMGTLVTKGKGIGVVVATGMQTEMGKIAHLMQNTDELSTPLQENLNQLGKVLIIGALLLTAIVVLAGIWNGQDIYMMILAGISLAVAAIPEGLPAIVTITLALGVQRMIKKKAIIRKLPSVETLGAADVICSDKTGTLTENKMTVTQFWLNNEEIGVQGVGYSTVGKFFVDSKEIDQINRDYLQFALEVATLCNNASIQQTRKNIFSKNEEIAIHGDPTEVALLVAAAKLDIRKEDLNNKWKLVKEFPFDANRKMMSVLVKNKQKQMLAVKGAPEILLHRCETILLNGKIVPLTSNLRQMVLQVINKMAKQALRTIGLAYRDVKLNESFEHELKAEQNLVFIGIAGMIDPPRYEVREAVKKAKLAGIKTVMITGDHQTTAEAIAKQLGIMNKDGLSLTGNDLNNLSDEQLVNVVDNVFVFSRVSPDHKLRIVKALQENRHIVAMTGDGVNDAPAIKAANIGVAMGISGTDVAKEASDLVISDDNYSTIIAAVEEGRNIFANIRKFIRYLLASNVGEILTMFVAMLFALPLPLVPIQILWVNLVTDGLPAIALSVDPIEQNVMKQKPRKKNESIFADRLGWKIISRGILIGLVTVGIFWLQLKQNPTDLIKAQTMAFVTLVMAQLIHVFDCRSDISIFHRDPFSNFYLVLATLSSVLLLLSVVYIPVLQPVFHTVALNKQEWALIIVLSAIPSFFFGFINYFFGKKN